MDFPAFSWATSRDRKGFADSATPAIKEIAV
jgi:hypothetical protein